eukprot:TRINITY_DN3069_c1_g4_i3.p1 TRINITY_DN3069_c1_g4~~TRINITY_DN3069_c1_g4_i3.p1  ORF type:complete len:440 (-),score=56.91 TRINITY_DN3069_c1_g4_i3:45-1364(-)
MSDSASREREKAAKAKLALLEAERKKGPPVELLVVDPTSVKNMGLECAICLSILTDPMQCTNGHLFCQACITRSIESSAHCPACRCRINLRNLSRGLIVEKLLASLLVHCPNHLKWSVSAEDWVVDEQGCHHKGERSKIEEHKKLCPHTLLPCPFSNLECGLIRRKEMDLHTQNCPARLVECPNCRGSIKASQLAAHGNLCPMGRSECPKCEQSILNNELSQHLRNLCPENEINCPFGCEGLVVRRNLKEHVEGSVFEHLELMRVENQKALLLMEEKYKHDLRERDQKLEELDNRSRLQIVTWELSRWSKIMREGQGITSPIFTLMGYRWRLLFEPKLKEHSLATFVGVFLYPEDKLEDKYLEVTFQIIIENRILPTRRVKSPLLRARFPASDPTSPGWGDSRLIKSDLVGLTNGLVVDDTLLLTVHIGIAREGIFMLS